MQHHDPAAEAVLEALEQLRRERDLGHEHQGLTRTPRATSSASAAAIACRYTSVLPLPVTP